MHLILDYMISKPQKQIIINQYFYEYFLNKKILDNPETFSKDDLINRIEGLSRFAYLNHTGLFYDIRTEGILLELGRSIDETSNEIDALIENEDFSSKHSTLHIATEIYKTGGHTRILAQLVKRSTQVDQYLILTKQKRDDLPEWFVLETSDKLRIVTLTDTLLNYTLLEKALFLRKYSRKFERVILYVHPYDALPILSFAEVETPPVLLENHAHSWFWLGSSISDIVFSHTEFHKKLTDKYRQVKRSTLLEIPQDDDLPKLYDRQDKREAKRRLFLDPELTCITIIGNKSKFYPLSEEYNVFQLIKYIIERFTKVNVIVVGLTADLEEIQRYQLDLLRVRFVGYQAQIHDYYLASDICLDSIPEPSLGATTMSAVIGLACPLYKYGRTNIFNAANFFHSELYNSLLGHSETIKEYLGKIEFLIYNPDLRIQIATEFRNFVLDKWSASSIEKNINDVLELANTVKHEINYISDNKIYFDENSHEIAGVSHLKSFYDMIMYFRTYYNIRDLVRIFAHLSKDFSNHPELLGTIYKLLANHFTFNNVLKVIRN